MRLRPADPAESDTLDRIARAAKAHWGYTAQELAGWEADLVTPPATIRSRPTWVAEVGGRPVAFGQLDPAACPWELVSLWVLPEHMGRGAGRAVLGRLLALARAAGQAHVRVDSDPNAVGFYTACGGTVAGFVPAPLPREPGRARPQLLLPTAPATEATHTAAPIQEEAMAPMPIHVRIDDLGSPEVEALIAEHLAGMRGHSPPGHAHALALDGLRRPEITFWTAWRGAALCGCGALRALDARAGEVKSMRTRPAYLRQGVGQAILDEIVRTARARGYATLHLETGTGEPFAAAHALYLRNGFAWSGPFGDYVATDFNVFMAKPLRPDPAPEGR